VTRRTFRRAVAFATALWLSTTGCDPGAAPGAAPPSPYGSGAYGSGTYATGTARAPGEPTDAEIRAAAAAYLAEVRAEVVSVNVKDGHLGLYVRGVPEWSLDQFVEQLPLAAATTREMLVRWPALADVDICGDGPWLPHPAGVDFVPAVRVQVFRDRLARLPERFASPAQVLGLGLVEPHALEHYVDDRIRNESAAYRTAYKNAGSAARATPS
jgi:hypothetical protein